MDEWPLKATGRSGRTEARKKTLRVAGLLSSQHLHSSIQVRASEQGGKEAWKEEGMKCGAVGQLRLFCTLA